MQILLYRNRSTNYRRLGLRRLKQPNSFEELYNSVDFSKSSISLLRYRERKKN